MVDRDALHFAIHHVVHDPVCHNAHVTLPARLFAWRPRNTFDGVDAAHSGPIGDNGETWIATTVVGPGTVSFWWQAYSEPYADWLEFYNNCSSAFDLDGCLLTDDSTRLVKWVFPDTALAAGQYLIVWADADTEQAGLHANFVLPKPGATVVFSDADGHPIDRVVFGPQSSDVSFGRYPNGAGSFRLMNPTFGAANDSGVGVAESPAASVARLSARAFPNPFIRSSAISYTMPARGRVSVRVFDSAGRLVTALVNAEQGVGVHSVRFSSFGCAASVGVYFAQVAIQPEVGEGLTESVKLVRTR